MDSTISVGQIFSFGKDSKQSNDDSARTAGDATTVNTTQDTTTTTNEPVVHDKTFNSEETAVNVKAAGPNDEGSHLDVDREVAPAVEHETVYRQHEDREQTVIDRERHQDHYHTTVQPLKDREVEPEVHDQKVAPIEDRSIDKDTNIAGVQASVDADRSGFRNTSTEGQTWESKTKEDTLVHENVHHHYHETVQPVIEKETVKPSVTHTTIPVHETIQEASKNEGVTTNEAMSLDDWERTKNLSGDNQ